MCNNDGMDWGLGMILLKIGILSIYAKRPNAMSLEVFHISSEHRRLLDQLRRAIPDFDPNIPENLQRIFSLGLFALLMQVTSKSANVTTSDLIVELAAAAKEMIGDRDR
jgi:hypothetical protein